MRISIQKSSERVCEKLGLKPATLSTQIVQRDRHAEFMTTLAVIASSIDRGPLNFVISSGLKCWKWKNSLEKDKKQFGDAAQAKSHYQ